MHPLDRMETLEEYRRLFTDAVFWQPYVRLVCQRLGLGDGEALRSGLPGTCPTFISGERWVIKFFGRLFDGETSFRVEQEAARLAALDPAIPAVAVRAAGQLDLDGAGWPWPYLVFDYIPAASLGEQMQQLRAGAMVQVAAELGGLARRLHALPLNDSPVFSASQSGFLAFLTQRRAACISDQRAWGTLPPHLVEQIEAFLPPLEELASDGLPPHLIHADLTRDHLLGRVQDGDWNTLALIDFGDAMQGSLWYELVALHLDLFGGERALLAAFLDAYSLPPPQRAGLPCRALAACLLHPFNVLACLPPERLQVSSLEDLAQQLFPA